MKDKDLNFSFEFVDKPRISKEINKLDGKKTFQEHDILVKLIKSKIFFLMLYTTILITPYSVQIFPQT